MARATLGLAMGLVVGLGPTVSRSATVSGSAEPDDPDGLTLRWEAPRECPDGAGMRALVDATLNEVESPSRRAVDVDGRVEPDEAEGYRLVLQLDGGRSGTRELRGASCRELSEAAALVIAMAIDPRLLERVPVPSESAAPPQPKPASEVPLEPEPEPESEVEPGTIESPESTEEPEPEPPVSAPAPIEPSRRLSWVGHLEAGVAGGPLPGTSGIASAMGGVGGRAWRVELGASIFTPRTTTSPSNPAVGVRAWLWAVAGQGCGEPRWRELSIPLCAGLLAGAVQARGVGELTPRERGARWVALTVEPGLVWWAGARWGLGLRARGHAVLARPDLRSEPSGTIFVGSAVGGSLRAGVELRLP